MSILLTNDDGIDAAGLAHLARALAGLDDLIVFAPLANCSGVGHSITIAADVRILPQPPGPDGGDRVAVDGTPADAVKFALKHHCVPLPRLAVSGINAGPNVGVNVLYSGTVGAAFEALIHDVSAVAVSVAEHADPHYETAARFARRVVASALALEDQRRERGEEPPFCLNLNVPGLPYDQVKGLRVTRHGRSGFDEFFRASESGEANAYTVDGVMRVHDPSEEYCARALEAGYASLTPLQMDLTDLRMLERLREEFHEEEPPA